MTSQSPALPEPSPGRLFLFLGLGLSILTPLAWIGQVLMGALKVPWYLPAVGTLAVVLVGVSVWQSWTVWRGLTLALALLLSAADWAVVLMTRLPNYPGTLAERQLFPEFKTSRANGQPFTQADLRDTNTVLVFFRGWW
jgi:hypothetical protein